METTIADSILTSQTRTSVLKLNLNFKKRKSDAFKNPYEIGSINYETPLSYFLKTFYNKTLSCYIYHQEIIAEGNIKNYIFILEDDILLTNNFEDEKNSQEFNYVKTNPIILKIDYKKVKII
jgi:hypothetical protein